jgi:hypothetical protein
MAVCRKAKWSLAASPEGRHLNIVEPHRSPVSQSARSMAEEGPRRGSTAALRALRRL